MTAVQNGGEPETAPPHDSDGPVQHLPGAEPPGDPGLRH